MNNLEVMIKDTFGTDLAHVTNEQIYVALLGMVKKEAEKKAKGHSDEEFNSYFEKEKNS